MGGGTGLKYAASTIIYLGKKKEKTLLQKIVGNIKCDFQSKFSKGIK